MEEKTSPVICLHWADTVQTLINWLVFILIQTQNWLNQDDAGYWRFFVLVLINLLVTKLKVVSGQRGT